MGVALEFNGMIPTGRFPTSLELKEHSRELVQGAHRLLQQSVMLNAKLRAMTMAAYKLQKRVSRVREVVEA